MKKYHRIFTYSLFAFLSIALSACSGQSFLGGQSFPGSQLFDSSSKPAPLPKLATVKPSINVKKIWQVKTGSANKFSKTHPLIAAQSIYVASGNVASAWDKSTAKSRWKTNIGETISAGVNNSQDGKQLFIGTTNGNAIALNANTGKVLWIERLNSEVLSVSRAKNNRVVFRTIDGKLHGLNSHSGEIIWQQRQPTPALSLYGASVPRIIGNETTQLVISGFDNGKIAAYSLQTGSRLWEATLAEPRGQNELDRMVDIDGKFKIMGNALFASSLNGNMAGIDVLTGKSAWARSYSSATGFDANPNGLYSADSEGNIWKFQPQTGAPAWKMDDLKRREPTTPILVSPTLVVVGDKQGNLHWINTTNGKFAARTIGDPTGYAVAPVVNGNSVYAFSKGGVLTKMVIQ